MSGLAEHLPQYLQLRRALGYRLVRAGRLLPRFVALVHQAGARVITTDLALAWATQSRRGTPAWAAERLRLVRGFARYVHARSRP
jgi:integrase/recombinase XerD